MITAEKILRELALDVEHAHEDDTALHGLERAFAFLAKHGAPLTPVQKDVLMFGTLVAHKNETDTWDHEVTKRSHGETQAALFERLEEEKA